MRALLLPRKRLEVVVVAMSRGQTLAWGRLLLLLTLTRRVVVTVG